MESNPIYLRLKQAIDWLKFNRHMMKQDIAAKMGMTGVSFSRGLARCKEKNDEDFVIRFHRSTGEVFSLDWLLHGTGEKFTADINKSASHPDTPASSPIDPSSILNAALAAQMQTIESLKSEKATLLEVHARELKAKDDLIQSLRDQLAAKDQLIAEQKARLIDYRRIIDSHNGISDYPFPIGAAEPEKRTSVSPYQTETPRKHP